MYNEAVNTSINSVGTLQHQQDIYMESTAAHLEQLRTEADRTYDILFDQDAVNSIADAITGVITVFNNFLEGVGGGISALTTLGAVAVNVFNQQIGQAISKQIENRQKELENAKNLTSVKEVAENGMVETDNAYKNEAYKNESDNANKLLGIVKNISTEEYNRLNTIRQEVAQNEQLAADLKTQKDKLTTSEEISQELKNQNNLVKEQIHDYQSLVAEMQAMNSFDVNDMSQDSSRVNAELDVMARIEQIQNNNLVTAEQKISLQEAYNKIRNDEVLSEEETEKILQIQKDVLQQQINKKRELTKELQLQEQLENGALEATERKIADDQKEFDFSINADARQAVISDAIKGLTSLITVATSLTGVFSTLSDESLSFSEKISRVGSTLLFMAPMILGNLKSITSFMPNLAVAIGAVGPTAEVSFLQATKSVLAFETALGPVWAVLLGVSAAIGGLIAIVKLGIDAWNADADAAEEAANQVKNLTERYNELNNTAIELKNSISEYDDAINALEDLTEGTDEYSEALENANDKARELIETYGLFDKWSINNGLITIDEDALNQAIEDAEKAASKVQIQTYGANIISNQAQLKSNTTDLSRDIGPVIDKIENSGGSEDFRNFTNDELQDAAQAIANLTEANNRVTLTDEQLKEQLLAMGDSLDKTVRDNIDTIISNRQALEDLADSMNDAKKANEYYAEQILGIKVEDTYGNKLEGMATDKEGNINESLYNQLIAATTTALANSPSNQQSLDDAIDKIDVSQATSTSKTNEILKEAGAGYSIVDDEDLAMKYAEKVLGYDTTDFTYKGGINKGTVKDETGTTVVDAVSDDTMRQALAREAKIDQLTEQFAQTSEDTGAAFVSSLDKLKQGADQFGKQFNANITGALLDTLANAEGDISSIDFSSIFSDLNPEEVAQLSGLDEDSLLGAFGLTKEDLEALGLGTSEEFLDAWNTGLDQYDSSAWEEKLLNSVKSAKSDIETLISGVQTGDITSSNIGESEEYADLLDQLDNIKDKDEDLTAAADLLGKTWLVGTQEYEEALEIVQDKLYAINLEDLINQADEAKEKVDEFISEDDNDNVTIDIDTNPEAFEAAMDDLLNQEYEIDIAIHSEAEQEFNSISNAFDDIKAKSALIGEDFIVAAEDVRALNDTFPGIVENMTTLADGTVQLNEQVVQSAMGMAEVEAQADAQSTTNKLHNQATLLRAKQQSYQNMANAALVLATTEIDSDEDAAAARATISAELANLKKYNSQESSQSEVNNEVEIADSSNINARTVAQNWQSAFQSMSDSSYEAASTAIANMNAVANGGTATKGTVGVNYSGSTGQSSEASILQQTQEALDSTTNGNNGNNKIWGKLAEQYAELADSAGAAANDIEGMIAQIGAAGTDLDKMLSNISSGKGASGGGSGRGGSKKEPSTKTEKKQAPDNMDRLEDEVDIYHDINLQIERLEKNLNKLDKQQKKLFGKDLIKNLNAQLKVLEKQKDAYQDKLKIAKDEAKEARKDKKGTKNDSYLVKQGVKFDKDGYITNYAKILEAKEKHVNKLVDKYNKMSKEEQDKFKDTVEAAKKDYDKLKTEMEEYDELISETIPDLKEKIQDIIDEETEKKIQKFTMEVELRVDMGEVEREFNEFKRKTDKEIKKAGTVGIAKSKKSDYESYFNTAGAGTGSIQSLTKQINDTIAQIDQINKTGTSSVYDKNKAKALEDLKTYYEQLMQELEDVADLEEEIKESYLDVIDEVSEAFDKQVDQYDFINDLLEHDKNVIGLVYGDKAYDQMANYYSQIEKNNNQELDFLKKRTAYAAEMMQKETDPEAKKKWEEEWMNSVSQLNSKVEDSIQNIIDKYENAIDGAFDKLNKKLTDGKGLDYVNEEWDLINKNADMYLDTLNGVYEVQSLENKYLQALDQTDSLSGQKKLNDAMNEQLSMLREKDKLTQYDIDRANKQYEITLKQIALEEAQQNKSQMRLRRDSQGNYSYQFVADEDKVAQTKQELLALENDLYNLDKNRTIELFQANLEAVQEWEQKRKEIMLDASLSDEERLQRLELIDKMYGDRINANTAELEVAKQNMRESTFIYSEGLYDANAKSFEEMTGKNIEDFRGLTDAEKDMLIQEIVPQWDSGVAAMSDKFAGEGGFIPTCQQAFNDLGQATDDYQGSLNDLQAAAGVDFHAIAQGYDENINQAQGLLEKNDDLISQYQGEVDAIKGVIDELDDLIAKYKEAQKAAEAAVDAAHKLLQDESKKAAKAASTSGSKTNSKSGKGGKSSKGGKGGGKKDNNNKHILGGVLVDATPKRTKADWNPQKNDKVTLNEGKQYYSSSDSKAPVGSLHSGTKDTLYITKVNTASWANRPYHIGTSPDLKTGPLGWVTKDDIEKVGGYDTGGYTGDWKDTSGKLAFLHQKEIVLNKYDTTNFLTAIKMVRDMASMLNNLNANVMDRLAGLSADFTVPVKGGSTTTDTLEQNVHIDAHFPNVKDSREIEEAFNNLVNIASQRIYQNKV